MNDSKPNCDKCFDTGVKLVRGEPTPCDCPKGQSDDGLKEYRKVMVERKIEKIRAQTNRVVHNLVIKWQCSICHDIHFVCDENGKVIPCVCQVEARRKAREAIYLKLCNLPDARPEWTLDRFTLRAGCDEMLESAKDMVSGKIKWLTIVSKSGYGKTHILVGICREFLRQSKSARYIFVPDVAPELKQGFDQEGLSSYESKMNFFKNVSLLALDDLGTENSTPWVREQLETIIDYRYVNKLPLVVTTNKSLEGLMPRVASRLKRIEIDGIGRTVIPSGLPYQEYLRNATKRREV